MVTFQDVANFDVGNAPENIAIGDVNGDGNFDLVTNLRNDEQPLQGAMLLARAIEEARDIMFSAPWLLYSPTPLYEKAAAERQLKHQISAALDQGFIVHDPLHPEFRSLNQHNQYGLFNPDNRYHIATISTPGTYVIRGKRGTSADFQIQVGTGRPGFNENLTSPITLSQLSLEDLIVDDDGNFEIVISDTKTGDNWLSNTKDGLQATNILIRESFMDWEKEMSGTWYIERSDTRGKPKPLPNPELVNDQYTRASEYLVGSVRGWVKFVDGLRANLAVNRLSPPRGTDAGLPGQRNSAGHFPIQRGKAIIITVPDSKARYQSIQIGDLWFNGLDYCHRQTSLTRSQARQSCDGNYRFVISTEDPGIANWLDPAGASTAFAFLRWQGLPEDYKFPKNPSVEVVDFDQLRDCLPNESYFSPEARVEQLAARQASSLTSPRGF
ncbi:hypothetical protein C1752_01530 [Acaryochloris thomasi RCC1774]|uniref:DUF1214 domain-containing protein n=1 Tax=Acaryochloris thomasi RCC1774 TaxID=1764569 RepID=A0A2W1JK49_9CYAN|nr:hypothetical protein [Acaryochloris thomasi]PZD73759.1 hypothetical protein C1752_01530 [Acaryochloris thomasi RCC1774]